MKKINTVFYLIIKSSNKIIIFSFVIQVNKSINNNADLNSSIYFNNKGLEKFQISFLYIYIFINIIRIYNNINLQKFFLFSLNDMKLECLLI